MNESLAGCISTVVSALPIDLVEKLANILFEMDNCNRDLIRLKLKAATTPIFQKQVDYLLDAWQNNFSNIGPESIGWSLLSAAEMKAKANKDLQLEVVWTGPESQVIPMRRSDQVLVQLIQSAHEKLWIVSFAIYKAQTIMDALAHAIKNKVSVNILIELEHESRGRLSHDAFQVLDDEVKKGARIYFWPFENRPCGPNGSPGVVHAKCAVADGKSLLISSANLTNYALDLNMEMGLLVQGGDTPSKVERHFEALVSEKVIRLYSLMDL